MRVLCLAGDPGGARSVAAVARVLQARGHTIVFSAYRQAMDIFREYGWQSVECRGGLQVDAMLSQEKPDFCLSGTSVNGEDHEKTLHRLAHDRRIPSLAVLDFWSNYRPRFSASSGGPLDSLPDQIAVMDEVARDEMIQNGFPAERLQVTGQPAYDELFAPRDSQALRSRVRTAFGLPDDQAPLILFASQPFSELRAIPGAVVPPYDELEVLDLLTRALYPAEKPSPARLWIRPHPREQPEKFLRFAGPHQIISGEFDRLAAIDAADAVVGMSSAFLLEAALVGKPVLSIQPRLEDEGPLPLERLRLGKIVRQPSEVPEELRELLANTGKPHYAPRSDAGFLARPGAANRVADLVEKMAITIKRS